MAAAGPYRALAAEGEAVTRTAAWQRPAATLAVTAVLAMAAAAGGRLHSWQGDWRDALQGGAPVVTAADLLGTAPASGAAVLPDCGVPAEYCAEPRAKKTVRRMDALLMTKNGMLTEEVFKKAMRPLWSEDFLYTSAAFGDMRGLKEWYDVEYLKYNAVFPKTIFTQMLFLGDDSHVTTTTYGATHWTGNFNGVDGGGAPVTLRITDSYKVNEKGEITYNFMLIDWADTLRQLGRPVLPKAALPEGFVLPPAVMKGVPAPMSQFADPASAERARRTIEKILQEDFVDQSLEASGWDSELTWYGPVGFGMARNVEQYREHFLKPMRRSFASPSLELKVVACEDSFCGAHGWLHAVQKGAFLGRPASNKTVSLRFGMHWRVEGDRAVEGWAIFDLPAFFKQLGEDIFATAAAQAPSVLPAQPQTPPPFLA